MLLEPVVAEFEFEEGESQRPKRWGLERKHKGREVVVLVVEEEEEDGELLQVVSEV